MKYRVIEREYHNGTVEYYVQGRLREFGGWVWIDYNKIPLSKEQAIQMRDEMNGLRIKSEKEIE